MIKDYIMFDVHILPSFSVSIPRVANFLARAGGKGIVYSSNL